MSPDEAYTYLNSNVSDDERIDEYNEKNFKKSERIFISPKNLMKDTPNKL